MSEQPKTPIEYVFQFETLRDALTAISEALNETVERMKQLASYGASMAGELGRGKLPPPVFPPHIARIIADPLNQHGFSE